MKQTKLLLISVFALGGLLSATSCGEEVTPTLYNVETSAGAGTTITLSGDKTSFQPGEMVTFTVALTSTDGSQELKTVMFGDTSLAIESDGTYEIAMPNEDVTITTTAGPVEVTDYAVTFNEGDGSTITLTTGDGATRFAPGAEVSFTVAVDDERITTLDSVTVDGKAVEAIDGTYTFTMPSKDVEIATTTTILGDGSLLNISDVAFEVKSIEDIQTLLTQSAEKEADYINGGRVVEDGVSSYDQSYDYTYSIGSDNKLSYEGTMTSYDSAVLSSYVYHEVGLYDATHYYEFNFNSTSGASVNAMSVVGDDATYSSGTIKESEAKQKVSMAGFSETVASYMRNIDTIEEQSTSDDNKYLTIVTSGENVSYAEYTKYDLSLVFDGDGLIRQAELKTNVYDIDDYDETTESLVEGATPTGSGSSTLTTERGYKKPLDSKYDVRDYVVNDYTVITGESFEGESTSFIGGGEVNNGSILSFTYRSSELKPMKLNPRPVQIVSDVEEIATLSGSSISVKKEGEFTVVFDNGLGDLKELTFTSVRPKARRISATMSSTTIFVGGNATVSAEITPEQALQDYTVSLKEGSECTVDITENEDGTFNVFGKTAGNGTLIVTSAEDSSIYEEVEFSVVTPPTYEDLYQFITQNTVKGQIHYSYEDLYVYVNFNDDGTGEFRVDDDYYGITYGSVVAFTYTLDKDTLEFTMALTDDSETSNSYTLYSVSAISNSSLEITIDRYGRLEDPCVATSIGEKVDLETYRE